MSLTVSHLAGKRLTTSATDEDNDVTTVMVYSGESGYTTPTVTYTYDNKTNAYGKLTKVSSSASATEYLTFDNLGRVTSHKQTTDSNDYTTGYTYSLSGQLLEQTYPSGRVVKNSYDAADGSLSQVQSKRSSETYRNFANGFVFNSAGAVTAMKLGNGKWENTVFNSRLQPTQIGLGNGVNSQNLLKLQYNYGTTANNGNVVSQTITVPGVANPFIQTYSYDELNRLTNAEEIKNSFQQWEQSFTYDRFGNRNFNEAETTTLPKNCGTTPNFTVCTADKKIVNPSVNTANNRLSTSDNYAFDSVGNTTADAAGRTFVYDAENKQISVSDGSGTIGEYSYDGDGKRIKKYVPDTGETTIFVYDAGGKLIQEHSTVVQTGSNAKTVYTTSDPLGSPRINTDGTGQVISRHDYHPFGEEVSRSGYGSDTIRKQFTGYERDGETGLDFAEARHLNTGHARFTAVDPYNIIFAKEDAEEAKDGDGKKLFERYLVQPQNWNRYVYVWNNPLRYVDPDGEKVYVVLYAIGNSDGTDNNFRRAAETQAENIRKDGQFDPKKDVVLVLPVMTKDNINAAFDIARGYQAKGWGGVAQVQVFSHAGPIDGPVFHDEKGKAAQWTTAELKQLNISWEKGASAYFFGCRTASWAQKFADAQNVSASGYKQFSYFSSASDSRVDPKAEGPLYLLAADGGKNGFFEGVRYAVGAAKVYAMERKDPSKKK